MREEKDGLSCLKMCERVSVEESVKKRKCAFSCCWFVQLLASEEAKRGQEWLAWLFMLPGSPCRAEWHQSFSLDEIYKFETPTPKTIPALNNDLKFFLLQHQASHWNSSTFLYCVCFNFGVSKIMLLFNIWLHSGLFYSYPMLSCWFNFLDMKAVKELYERKR